MTFRAMTPKKIDLEAANEEIYRRRPNLRGLIKIESLSLTQDKQRKIIKQIEQQNINKRIYEAKRKNDKKQNESRNVIDSLLIPLEKIVNRLYGLEKSILDINKNKRQKIIESVKTLHLQHVGHSYYGNCPCCGKTTIVKYQNVFPMKTEDFTIDHFRGRFYGDLESTWPICRKCNNLLHNQTSYWHRSTSRFSEYQGSLIRYRENQRGQQDLDL